MTPTDLLKKIHDSYLSTKGDQKIDFELPARDSEAYEEIAPYHGLIPTEIPFEYFDVYTRVFRFLPTSVLPCVLGSYFYQSVVRGEFWSMSFDMISDIPSFSRLISELTSQQRATAADYLEYSKIYIESGLILDTDLLIHELRKSEF